MSVDKNSKISKIAVLSFLMLFGFVNFTFTALLAIKTNFFIFIIAVIFLNLILTPALIFLEISGGSVRLLKKWNKVPRLVHYGLVLIIGAWIGFLMKYLLPELKKQYERSR